MQHWRELALIAIFVLNVVIFPILPLLLKTAPVIRGIMLCTAANMVLYGCIYLTYYTASFGNKIPTPHATYALTLGIPLCIACSIQIRRYGRILSKMAAGEGKNGAGN